MDNKIEKFIAINEKRDVVWINFAALGAWQMLQMAFVLGLYAISGGLIGRAPYLQVQMVKTNHMIESEL